MTLKLTNPDNLVKRASISLFNGCAWLAVETVNGCSSEGFTTEFGAKQYFGKEFMRGAIWEIDTDQP